MYAHVCMHVYLSMHKHAHLGLGNGQTVGYIYTTFAGVTGFCQTFWAF